MSFFIKRMRVNYSGKEIPPIHTTDSLDDEKVITVDSVKVNYEYEFHHNPII